jgi:YVTN family beta-propeller protein
MEASGTLLTLDQNFNVIHTVATAAKPYGVAFDRDGRRIFVAAAAAKKLQIYSADTLQLLGEAPIGQRCWHFTFTPDDSKILLACGRSNAVYVVDARTYQTIKVIGGFQMPWGIITYPRSYGSLGLP